MSEQMISFLPGMINNYGELIQQCINGELSEESVNQVIDEIFKLLNAGELRVAEKIGKNWNYLLK